MADGAKKVELLSKSWAREDNGRDLCERGESPGATFRRQAQPNRKAVPT